jgi:hypothetical protein
MSSAESISYAKFNKSLALLEMLSFLFCNNLRRVKMISSKPSIINSGIVERVNSRKSMVVSIDLVTVSLSNILIMRSIICLNYWPWASINNYMSLKLISTMYLSSSSKASTF